MVISFLTEFVCLTKILNPREVFLNLQAVYDIQIISHFPLKVGVCLHSDIPLPGCTTDYELNICSIHGEEWDMIGG